MGYFLVRSVKNFRFVSMTLVNTALVRCASGSLVCYSCLLGSCELVEFILLLAWCTIFTLTVGKDRVRYLVTRLIINLYHVAKYPSFISCGVVFLNGMKSLV